MKKGILILFLSEYRDGKESAGYSVEGEEPQGHLISGIQTNDAPVKYLINCAAKDDSAIQKIVCIVSKRVLEKGDYEKFQSMVKNYIQEQVDEADHMVKIPEFCQVDYDESCEETEERSRKLYQRISSCFRGEEGSRVYIDYTGGLRDISFLMTVIIRYLEYQEIHCRKIVYSNVSTHRIYAIDCVYDMFQLINGVDQFVRTGNAERLSECSQMQQDLQTKKLLESLIEFSKAMSLCDVRSIDQILREISAGLSEYHKEEKDKNFFIEMFGDLIELIRKKMYISEDNRLTYPQLIHWCLDNNMIQQALTLYVEKIPKYYYDEEMLIRPENIKPGLSGNLDTTAFYEYLFGKQIEDKNLADFAAVLGTLDVSADNFSVEEIKRKASSFGQNPIVKKALLQMVQYLNTYYKDGVGDRKDRQQIMIPYEKKGSVPKTGKGMINDIKTKKYYQHYFIYNDKKGYEKLEAMETYEKKVAALDVVRKASKQVEGSCVDNSTLYKMMKYYCALKLMRNRINHASEAEKRKDEERATKILEEDHGICMDVTFDNTKALIDKGLEACTQHIIS